MPSNTTVHELVEFARRFNCIQKAMKAEFRLSRLRKAKEKATR